MNIKYFIPAFITLALLVPLAASATPTSWDFAAGILQPLQSQWTALVKADHYQATSTTASIFPYASTTALSGTYLCLSNDCRTVWPSSGSGTVTQINTTFPILGGPITTTGTLSFGGLSTSTAAVVGNIPYFSGLNTFANVATTSVTCTGGTTCSSFTTIGSSPVTINSSTGGTGTVSTSSSETANYIPKWTSTNGTPALLAGTSLLYDSGTTIGISSSSPSGGILGVNGTSYFSDAVGIGLLPATSTSPSTLKIATTSSVANTTMISGNFTSTASSGTNNGISITATYTGAGDIPFTGLNSSVISNATVDCTQTSGNGGCERNRYQVTNGALGHRLASMAAVTAKVQTGASSLSSTTLAIALNAETPGIAANTVIDTFAGVYVQGGTPVGTLTTRYGVYVDNLLGGTTRYGLYQAGASDSNYFAGNTGISSTTPGTILSIGTSPNQVANFAAATSTIYSALAVSGINNAYLSVGTTTPNATYVKNYLADFTGTLSDFMSVNVNNNANGICSSADLTVNNDAATVSANFGDFGHTSSAFTGSGCTNNPFTGFGGNSTYIFDPNGNMNFALASTSNASFRWFTAGYATSNQKMVLTNGGSLGIGTTSPANLLSVSNATGSLQSAYFVGNVGVGIAPFDNQLLRVGSTTFSQASGAAVGVASTLTYIGSGAAARTNAMNFQATFQGTVNNTATGNGGGIAAVQGFATNNAVGLNLALQNGMYVRTDLGGTLATTTNANGYMVGNPSILAGDIATNVSGFYVQGGAISGTATNRYGFYVEDLVGGTNRYGFYQAGGSDMNYFNGLTGIGTTSPAFALSVSTSTQQSGTIPLFTVASTTNATLLTVLGNGNVGIGTTSPGSVLSIQGNIFLAGKVVATSTATSTFAGSIQATCFTTNGTTCLTAGGSGTVTSVATDATLTGGTITTTGTLGINLANANSWTAEQDFNNGGLALNVANTSWYGLGGTTFAYASTTNQNTLLGLSAGGNIATTSALVTKTTAVGFKALAKLSSNIAANTAVGAFAGQLTTSGTNNTYIGEEAGNTVQGGANNVAVGFQALLGNSGAATESKNTVIGAISGSAMTSGKNNSLLGYATGVSITTGYDNIILGETQNFGGNNLTTGGGNILLGYNPLTPAVSTNSFFNIGNTYFGTLAATSSATSILIPTTGTFGIGTTSPFAKFSIAANNGDTLMNLFGIGSSTASATTTLFAIDNTGHLITGSPKGSLSSCGSTNSLNGNDVNGTIMFTGTLVTTCTLTFANPVATNQNLSCVVSASSLTATVGVTATSSTAVTFGVSTGLAADTLYYSCNRNLNN